MASEQSNLKNGSEQMSEQMAAESTHLSLKTHQIRFPIAESSET